ncbi:MAG: hypothetical protein E6J34_03355 [Chloroflexi bacterium]|jgi:uncharacterized membrane protein|nr:MAG: hypothetical protein E6J34_03355 [Chloroflexota bacterium]
MHFDLYHWLFDDPITAASNAGQSTPEVFHYLWPWLIFCCVGLLLTFYYSVEGRKRFVKSKLLAKRMLDQYLGWFAVICFVGLPILFSRVYLEGYFFAWRVWRYLWLVALICWAITWIVYLVRKYPQERASLQAYQKRQQYISKGSKRKAKAASR